LSLPSLAALHRHASGAHVDRLRLNGGLPHDLSGITFNDGPPSEKASLVYDNIRKLKGEQIATWTFDPKNQRQTSLVCSHAGTMLDLARTLPQYAPMCAMSAWVVTQATDSLYIAFAESMGGGTRV